MMHHSTMWHLTIMIIFGLLSVHCSDGSGFAGSSGKKVEPEKKEKPEKKDLKKDELIAANPDQTSSETDDASNKNLGESKAPSHAISKGSFSAWTEPKNPQPYQVYTIIIEVRLPKSTTNYTLADIDGTVFGTDGFRRIFGKQDSVSPMLGPFQTTLRFDQGTAMIRVPIPGAHNMVKDTIRITSSILNESQDIAIQFGQQGGLLGQLGNQYNLK